MTTKEQILKQFFSNPEKFISGEELASALGISRAAVWKAVKSLKKEGYTFEAITNKGYRLKFENDILTAEAIEAKLQNELKVFCCQSIDSTNSLAKRLLANSDNEQMLIVAEEQTQGRGRQGKSFYSPAGTGIYMSLVLHPNTQLQNTVGITTAAAVAVCKAIESLTDKKPQIKWVNDVFLDGKKICGILTEAVSDFESGAASAVIIGIGLNISTTDFPDSVENGGALGCDVKRADLIAEITNQLCCINWRDYGSFIDYYRSHSMIIGKRIYFIKNGIKTPATAVEICENGALKIRLDDGSEQTLTSGEISIRKID